MSSPTSVSVSLELSLMAPGGIVVPVRTEMRYDAADPFAVVVAFDSGASEPVCWTFARDLLAAGTRIRVGEGDVKIWPGTEVVFLGLSSPSGQALIKIPIEALTSFLVQTYDAVPAGTESALVDLDAGLAGLLA